MQQQPEAMLAGHREKSEQSSPFPDLSTLRKRWHAQFNNLPAIPASSPFESPASILDETSHSKQATLPELPAIKSMAALVSSSLQEEEPQAKQAADTDLSPFPFTEPKTEPTDDQSSAEETSDIWEPHISHQPTSFEPELELGLEPESEPSSETAADESELPTRSSDLVAKIRQGPADSSKDRKPSPFEPIAEEECEQTATPFAELHSEDSNQASASKYTDKDLQEALRPLIGTNMDHLFGSPSDNIHNYLEPLLRSTVRRAIAEQMTEASPFRDISGWHKFIWKLRALMSSRTYEDVLFDHTRRYQVEEAFLLRPQTRSLISYASHNPARHAKPVKVEATVRKIATKTASMTPNQSSTIDWSEDRKLVVRPGAHSLLAAIVHGSPNAVLEADLDYLLRQVEERLGKSLEDETDVHLHILQPMLECCLLIQSLASPN